MVKKSSSARTRMDKPAEIPPPRGLIARIASLEPAPPWGWNAVAITLAVSLVAGLLVLPLFVTAWFDVQPFTFTLTYLILGAVMGYWVASTRRSDADRAALRIGKLQTSIFLLLFIMIGLALLFDLLSLAVTGLFLPVMELATFDLPNASALDWILAFGLMVFAQPIGEELVFRGVLFPVMRARLGAWAGLILNAAAYGAFHFALYTPNAGAFDTTTLIWYGFMLPFLDGLVFAAVRAYTRSTRAAIFAHAAFGLFAVLKLFTITG